MEISESDKLAIIKDILLMDDREYAEAISKKIEDLEAIIHQEDDLSEKVNPIIRDRLDEFVEEIPATLGPVITETLKKEIKNSKDQVVEALYPIMGKMIKKYIAQEIKMLSERMSKQIDSAFSFRRWKQRLKSTFAGVKEEELILSEAYKPRIEQVFVIEKDSGILISNFSRNTAVDVDKDMVSGMLTAIKSFVEDAFSSGNQSLELIEYELYNIHIQSFLKYYVAVVVSGNYTTSFKDKLQDLIFDFSGNFLSLPTISDLSEHAIEKELKSYFENDF